MWKPEFKFVITTFWMSSSMSLSLTFPLFLELKVSVSPSEGCYKIKFQTHQYAIHVMDLGNRYQLPVSKPVINLP